MSSLAGAEGKLAEARFFLGFLERIEKDQPVTTDSLDNEATYFTSALLNACYSVLEHLKGQGKNALKAAHKQDEVVDLEDDVKKTFQQNPDLYNQGKHRSSTNDHGLRHLSVHHKVVDTRHHDHRQGTLGSARLGSLRPGETKTEHRLYVDGHHPNTPVWIVPRMTEHVRELEKLVTGWQNRITALHDAGAP